MHQGPRLRLKGFKSQGFNSYLAGQRQIWQGNGASSKAACGCVTCQEMQIPKASLSSSGLVACHKMHIAKGSVEHFACYQTA